MPATREKVKLQDGPKKGPREHTLALVERADDAGFDPVAGVLREVKLLGLKSRNGKVYLREAVKKAIPLCEGAPSYIDHPDGESNARKYGERFGTLHGVYQRNDGSLWAREYRYNPKHRFAEQFAWDVKNSPRGIGFSINGDGDGYRGPNGDLVVDRIDTVHSIDLVDGPATTTGLREQHKLVEGDMEEEETNPLVDPAAEPAPTPLDVPPPADSAAGGGMGYKDNLVSAVSALATGLKDGSVPMEDAKKKIVSILAMIDEAAPDSGVGDLQESTDAGSEEKPEEEGKLMESLRKSRSRAVRWAVGKLDSGRRVELREQCRKLAETHKVPKTAITDVFLDSLVGATNEAGRLRLIEDRRAVTGGPRSAGPTPQKSMKEFAADFWDKE